jgi:dTDP-glucose 4,6-dehydratase/UDP-glucose 4-epimerase
MGWEHVIPEFVSRLCREERRHDSVIDFTIQGSGNQSRAFIFIDDFIAGLMTVIERGENLNIYNIGTGQEVKIADLARKVAALLGLNIRLTPGAEAEGGTLRRCPDISKLQVLGFAPRCDFDEALHKTVQWYGSRLRAPAPSGPELSIFLKEIE